MANIPEQPLLPDRSQQTAMGSAEAFLEYLRFSKQDSDKFWEQIASEFEWSSPMGYRSEGNAAAF